MLGVALALLGWAATLPSSRARAGERLPPAVARRLTALFADPGSAWRVGSCVLRAQRRDVDAACLLHRLHEDYPDLAAALASGNAAAARQVLRECATRDFAKDRTFIVEGWVLARVEAHACALTCFV